MFGQVIDKLDTWFGHAFLLSRYMPCFIFIVLNALILYVSYPHLRPILAAQFAALLIASAIGTLVLILGGIALLAFMVAPFGEGMVRLLEGGWLLRNQLARIAVGEPLVRAQSYRHDAKIRRKTDLQNNRRNLILANTKSYNRLLSEAQRVGEQERTARDTTTLNAASEVYRVLQSKREARRWIAAEELRQVKESLEAALRNNCADHRRLRDDANHAECERAKQLSAMKDEFVELLADYSLEIADDVENHLVAQINGMFARDELAPTSFGNLAAALRNYCKTRYGIEWDHFWPRFLIAIQKNSQVNAPIVAAKIQLDFAVMSLALTLVASVVWIVAFSVDYQGPLRLFLALALGNAAVSVWNGVTHASYRNFAETARSAIDLARFDLLTALHQPLPPTAEAERQTWERLARLSLLGQLNFPLPFKHPS